MDMPLKIIPLTRRDYRRKKQAVRLMTELPEFWPAELMAQAVLGTLLAPGRLCLCAVDERDEVIGLAGGLPDYDGIVWELHPLVVKPDCRRRGVGRRLTLAMEREAAARGALTMLLGVDDPGGATTLSNVDLYDSTGGRIANVRGLQPHPFAFYQRLGYTVTGVIPDAGGTGKPDILMAKGLRKKPAAARPGILGFNKD